jgi:ubiquinone/menaquinone biosynthesis C-methylase UbiE
MGATVPAPQEASRRHFDRWGGSYSRSRLLASLQRKPLDDLALGVEDRVLDVACGAGKLVRAVAPRVQRASGVDLSPGMIEEAQRRTAKEGGSGTGAPEFLVGSSDNLPFADATFTAVVTTSAFHHFPDPAASVREMLRVLEPGGRIVIGDLSCDTPPMKLVDVVLKRVEKGHVAMQTRDGIERLLADAGAQVTRARLVWLGMYALVAAVKPAA